MITPPELVAMADRRDPNLQTAYTETVIRARDLAHGLDRANAHDRDLARDLALANALDRDLANAHDRYVANAHALDLVVGVDRSLDRALDRSLDRDLARDLAHGRDLARNLAQYLARYRTLASASDRDRDRGRNRAVAVDLTRRLSSARQNYVTPFTDVSADNAPVLVRYLEFVDRVAAVLYVQLTVVKRTAAGVDGVAGSPPEVEERRAFEDVWQLVEKASDTGRLPGHVDERVRAFNELLATARNRLDSVEDNDVFEFLSMKLGQLLPGVLDAIVPSSSRSLKSLELLGSDAPDDTQLEALADDMANAAEALASPDIIALTGADSDARTTVDSDARTTVDSDARTTVDGDARTTVDGDARTTVDSDARTTVDGPSDDDDGTSAPPSPYAGKTLGRLAGPVERITASFEIIDKVFDKLASTKTGRLAMKGFVAGSAAMVVPATTEASASAAAATSFLLTTVGTWIYALLRRSNPTLPPRHRTEDVENPGLA